MRNSHAHGSFRAPLDVTDFAETPLVALIKRADIAGNEVGPVAPTPEHEQTALPRCSNPCRSLPLRASTDADGSTGPWRSFRSPQPASAACPAGSGARYQRRPPERCPMGCSPRMLAGRSTSSALPAARDRHRGRVVSGGIAEKHVYTDYSIWMHGRDGKIRRFPEGELARTFLDPAGLANTLNCDKRYPLAGHHQRQGGHYASMGMCFSGSSSSITRRMRWYC